MLYDKGDSVRRRRMQSWTGYFAGVIPSNKHATKHRVGPAAMLHGPGRAGATERAAGRSGPARPWRGVVRRRACSRASSAAADACACDVAAAVEEEAARSPSSWPASAAARCCSAASSRDVVDAALAAAAAAACCSAACVLVCSA